MRKHAPQVEQALAELELAEQHGSTEHARAAEKRLAAAGHRRATAAEESADEREARSAPPRGRTARQPSQTAVEE